MKEQTNRAEKSVTVFDRNDKAKPDVSTAIDLAF